MLVAVLMLGGAGGTACAPTAKVPSATPVMEGIPAQHFVLHRVTGARLEGVDGIILPHRVRGRSGTGVIDIDRSDFRSIYVSNRSWAPELALLGLGVGAVFGLSVNAAALDRVPSRDPDPVFIAQSTGIVAAAFAGIFALVGLSRPKWDVIE